MPLKPALWETDDDGRAAKCEPTHFLTSADMITFLHTNLDRADLRSSYCDEKEGAFLALGVIAKIRRLDLDNGTPVTF